MSGRKALKLLLAGAVAVAALSLSVAGSVLAQSDVQARFVGVYELAAYAPHGDEPSGRISYFENGEMSAMLFPPGREPLTNDTDPEAYRAAMRGVVAYYGTYSIDVEAGTVTHHVQGGSNPAWIGTDFVRWYRFEGDELTLSLNARFQGTLLWRRLPAE